MADWKNANDAYEKHLKNQKIEHMKIAECLIEWFPIPMPNNSGFAIRSGGDNYIMGFDANGAMILTVRDGDSMGHVKIDVHSLLHLATECLTENGGGKNV